MRHGAFVAGCCCCCCWQHLEPKLGSDFGFPASARTFSVRFFNSLQKPFRAAQSATAVRWNRLVRVVECRKSRQKRAKKLSSAGPTTITLLYRSPIPSSPLNLGTVEYNKKVPAKRVEIRVESIKYAV